MGAVDFKVDFGLMKRSLRKTTGGGYLKWKELEEVLLDVEVALNNRPFQYVARGRCSETDFNT